MVDAPEKIRVAQDSDGFWTCREAISGSQEYVRADLVAELAEENERLRNMVDGYGKLDAELAIAERRIEALSRTGAVKALEWREFKALGGGVKTVANDCFGNEFRRFDMRLGQVPQTEIDKAQADYERRILSALEPPAPEGQQPVASAVRVCPVRDAVCPHGIGCLYNDGMDCGMEASRADLAYQKHATSYTRPSEQAVTEAAMSEAEEMFADYFRRNYPGPDTIIGRPDWHSPKLFRVALHALRSVGALKAAMEAGG